MLRRVLLFALLAVTTACMAGKRVAAEWQPARVAAQDSVGESLPEAIRTAALSPVDSAEALPVPQWKLGKATIRGRLYGYRPEMKIRVEVFPNFALDIRQNDNIKAEVAADGSFCVEVPTYATCQTVMMRIDDSLYYVVLRGGGTCEVYLDLAEEHRRPATKGNPKHTNGLPFYFGRLYFAGDMADVNNRLSLDEARKLMEHHQFIWQKANQPAENARYTPEEFCEKLMQWHADNLKAIDSICPSERTRTVMHIIQKYQTAYSLMYRDMFVKADPDGRPLFGNCIYDACRKLEINDMMMAYCGYFGTVGNCFQFLPYSDSIYIDSIRGIARSMQESPKDSVDQAIKRFDREYRARRLGWPDGPLFDLMRAEHFSTLLDKETPLSDAQLRRLDKEPNTVVREYFHTRNEELKAMLAARKDNGTYTIHAAPAGSGDEALAAIAKEYAGKAVLIDFWGTWCGPCRAAIKRFEDGKAGLMKQGVVFVYITDGKSPEDEWGNMASGIPGHHYRLTGAQTADLYKKYKLSGWPSYLILDKRGECVYSRTGFRENEITNKLNSIIQ